MWEKSPRPRRFHYFDEAMKPSNDPPAGGTRPFGGAFRDYLAPHTPLSRAKRRTGYAILAALFALGPIALIVAPVPPRLAVMYALYGAVIGALWTTRLTVLQLLGLAMFILHADSLPVFVQARSAYGAVSDWTGQSIVISVWVLVGFGPHVFLTAIKSVRRRAKSQE